MSVLVRVLHLKSHLHVAFHQVPMFAYHRPLAHHACGHVNVALAVHSAVLRGSKLHCVLRISESVACELRPQLCELAGWDLGRNLDRC